MKGTVLCLEANICWDDLKTGSSEPPRWGTGDRSSFPRKPAVFFGISPGDTLLILGNEASGLVVTKPEILNDLADEILGKEEGHDGH